MIKKPAEFKDYCFSESQCFSQKFHDMLSKLSYLVLLRISKQFACKFCIFFMFSNY